MGLKTYLEKLASGNANKKGQVGAVVALLFALVGGIVVALFHTSTVGVVADNAHNASTAAVNETQTTSEGAQALLNQYDLIYVAAGLIGFFVLIMNAAT